VRAEHPGGETSARALLADKRLMIGTESGQAPLALDTAAPVILGRRTFPGQAIAVGETRRWMAMLIAGRPSADDAVLALSELAANAVRHSDSRLPGGTFTVHATIGADLVRIEVADQGGPWSARPDDAHCGRGLAIVAALSHSWGIAGDQAGRTAWCEIPASQEPGPAA